MGMKRAERGVVHHEHTRYRAPQKRRRAAHTARDGCTGEKQHAGVLCAHVCGRRKIAKELLQPGDVISCGGSVTLDETGVMDLMRCGNYEFLDRTTAKTPEEREKLYREVFSSDVFLTGTNAVTEHGELYNVDGNGNRVAAMLFGPKKVLVFAGCNKIVRDIDDAAKRVKSCATPANAMRLNLDTPCTHGACPGTDGELCAGCRSENRICAMYTVLARQRVKGRIHVILIGEEVGY